jgi:hypothetical protein
MSLQASVSLLLVCSSSLCLALAPAALSSEDKKAYQVVATTGEFCSTKVGFAGQTPQVVVAFRILLKSPDAAAAFKGLLADGTTAGKLYALCGLYYADPDYFDRAVAPFRGSRREVATLMGCIMSRAKVGSIVESPSPKAVRLKNRKQTVTEWARETKTDGMIYDIVGGGWPSTFKESGS